MMEKYQFKTNINCGGCIAKVSTQLIEKNGIRKWEVDTGNPHKILTVETDELTDNQVITLLNEAGFKAEKI